MVREFASPVVAPPSKELVASAVEVEEMPDDPPVDTAEVSVEEDVIGILDVVVGIITSVDVKAISVRCHKDILEKMPTVGY